MMQFLSRRHLLMLGVVTAMIAGSGEVRAYPEPSILPISWELDVETRTPAIISVQLPTDDKPRLYWYMTYTVTNRTGEDQLFIPDVWMLTDAGDLMQANRGVPPTVFRRIKQAVRNPLLESPNEIVGQILQGPDQARDGVAIWPVPEHDVKMVRIFFGGLSGETQDVKDPQGGEARVLRKALMIEYATPGDLSHVLHKPFVQRLRRWVMR